MESFPFVKFSLGIKIQAPFFASFHSEELMLYRILFSIPSTSRDERHKPYRRDAAPVQRFDAHRTGPAADTAAHHHHRGRVRVVLDAVRRDDTVVSYDEERVFISE